MNYYRWGEIPVENMTEHQLVMQLCYIPHRSPDGSFDMTPCAECIAEDIKDRLEIAGCYYGQEMVLRQKPDYKAKEGVKHRVRKKVV